MGPGDPVTGTVSSPSVWRPADFADPSEWTVTLSAAERGEIAANISIIGYLLGLCSLPAIPVAGNGHNDRYGQCEHDQRRPVLLPYGF